MAQEIISVIVPVYNVSAFLEECVGSICGQTYPALDIVLVDDGSPDSSGDLCEQLAAKDARIQVIHQKNGGLSAARNAGIRAAVGSWLLFVDSDDWIAPTMAQDLYEAVQNCGGELACCFYHLANESGETCPDQLSPFSAVVDYHQFWTEYEKARGEMHVAFTVAWDKLYKKELFTALKFPEGKIHEDAFVLHEVIAQCSHIAIVPKRLYYYRSLSGSIVRGSWMPTRLYNVEAYLNRIAFFSNRQEWAYAGEALLEAYDQFYQNVRPVSQFQAPEVSARFRALYTDARKLTKKVLRHWHKPVFAIKGLSFLMGLTFYGFVHSAIKNLKMRLRRR